MIPFHFQPAPPPHHEAHAITIPAGLDDKAQLFALLRREIPLPDYFGNNWDALDECLADIPGVKDHQILLIHQDIPLAQTPLDQKTYLQILADAARTSNRLIVIFPEIFRPDVMRILPSADK